MLTEPLPIDIFIATRFEERRIAKFIENWPLEAEVLVKIVAQHFKDMGVYQVSGSLDASLTDMIITILRNSPAVGDLLHKAELAEAARRQSRHAQTGK